MGPICCLAFDVRGKTMVAAPEEGGRAEGKGQAAALSNAAEGVHDVPP